VNSLLHHVNRNFSKITDDTTYKGRLTSFRGPPSKYQSTSLPENETNNTSLRFKKHTTLPTTIHKTYKALLKAQATTSANTSDAFLLAQVK
jgi:hypothetical protein